MTSRSHSAASTPSGIRHRPAALSFTQAGAAAEIVAEPVQCVPRQPAIHRGDLPDRATRKELLPGLGDAERLDLRREPAHARQGRAGRLSDRADHQVGGRHHQEPRGGALCVDCLRRFQQCAGRRDRPDAVELAGRVSGTGRDALRQRQRAHRAADLRRADQRSRLERLHLPAGADPDPQARPVDRIPHCRHRSVAVLRPSRRLRTQPHHGERRRIRGEQRVSRPRALSAAGAPIRTTISPAPRPTSRSRSTSTSSCSRWRRASRTRPWSASAARHSC